MNATSDEGPANAGGFENERFRECPEVAAPGGGNGQTMALRCFANDGAGELMAGLYPSDVVHHDDHWAYGDVMTSAADAAVAREDARGQGRQATSQVGILLGIALERMKRMPTRYGHVRIPRVLKVWRVRTAIAVGDRTSVGVTVDVYADTVENAKVVAARRIEREALGCATAQPNYRRDGWNG